MKKLIFAVLIAALALCGCERIVEEIPQPEDAIAAAADMVTDSIPDETAADVNAPAENVSAENAPAETTGTEAVEETSAEAPDDDDDTVPEPEPPEEDEPREEVTEPEYGESDGTIWDVALTFNETTLEIGETVIPYVTMSPSDAPDLSEIWTSSDESVATVDWLGNITAVGAGKCTVTVRSAACPDKYAEVAVTVNAGVTAPTFIDGILVVNKTYALPKSYNPGVDAEAQSAFDDMRAAASDEGLNIYISSGFRSYEYQQGLYNRYVERSGKAEADRYSARAGHSEHQTGLAFDLNTIDDSFAATDEYTWVKAHCAEYGFIIRYPEGKEDITGYMYEPWHIRYLGKDNAKKVYDSGLTLEEYLGIDSKYDE